MDVLVGKEDSLILKGFAIISMIILHLFAFPNHLPESEIKHYLILNDEIINFCRPLNVCVSLFLFVSGIGLAYNAISGTTLAFFNTIKKSLFKFYNIYIPSLLIFSILLNLFPYNHSIPKISILDFLKALTCWDTSYISPIWWYASLFVECILILFPLSFFILRKFTYFRGWLLLFVSFIPCFILAFCKARSIEIFPLLSYLKWSPCFIVGYILGIIQYKKEDSNIPNWILYFNQLRSHCFLKRLGIVISILFLMFLTFEIFNKFSHFSSIFSLQIYNAISLFPICIFCLLIIFNFSSTSFVKKILMLFGKYSGLMWLIHPFIIYYYLYDFIYSFNNIFLIAIISISLSLVVAILINWLILTITHIAINIKKRFLFFIISK
ncbi:MAG: acyltransferase [Akkermansia sp.]